MTPTEDVIDSLVGDAGAVRRLRGPVKRAVTWLALSAIVIALLGLSHGVRPDLTARLGEPGFVTGFVAAIMTGVLSAVAALTASLPDRSRLWLLLPLPAAMTWVTTVTWGCMANWVVLGPDGVSLSLTVSCITILIASSIPLSAALFWMLRAIVCLRPSATVFMASLAVAGLSATALNLVHAFDASAMILLWNFGAALAVLACDTVIGRAVLRTGRLGNRLLRQPSRLPA